MNGAPIDAVATRAHPTRVLVMSGSVRTGSFNTRLAQAAARSVRDAGAEATVVDLRALDLPLYDGDLEAAHGVPAGARALRDLFAAHPALLLASPEYNAFVPPLVINTLAWVSRVPAEGAAPSGREAMAGTVAGVMSASPGALGGLRALVHLRTALAVSASMLVVPETVSVGGAAQAFDDEGRLLDARLQAQLQALVRAVLHAARP